MAHTKLTILMLGGARRVSVGRLLKDSGKRIGCEVKLVSYELNLTVPIAMEAQVVEGLKWSDPGVVDDIVRVAHECEAKVILPFVDGAISVAARCKSKLPTAFIPVGDAHTADILFDKVEAAKAFKEAGLPIPATYSVLSAQLPAIAKPRHGTASRGIKVFHNMERLMQLENIKEDYLLQAYIENRAEYTVDCYVASTGEILCTVPRERLEIMGGESTRTRTVHNEELEELSRQAIDAFNLRGPITIQYLYDIDKSKYRILEISPRLGGGVVCSIKAGAPITDYIIREALGVEVRECNDWAPDTLMARYWEEVIFHS